MSDFDFANHGSIVLLTPRTGPAQDWADEHLPEDAPMWGQCSYAIEARYAGPILEGIQNDGLTVEET